MKQLAIGAVALLLATGVAQANEYRLVPLSGATKAIIWKSKAAHNEALSLIQANVHVTNPSLVNRLVACLVDRNTRAIITDMGFATHDVLVTSGPHAGCRGNIPAEQLKR